MNAWMTVILVIHVMVALTIIGLVLLQHGKGADMGSGFGGGASGSLFGATGSSNFLSRTTAVLATLFFLTSLGLAYVATHKPKADGGVMDAVKVEPAKPAAAAGDALKADQQADPAAKPAGGSKAKDVPD